jgi:hypothetical protein
MIETQQSGKAGATAVAGEDWYEHGFARVENSRRRGVTSMPLPYAQTLMKWASYVPGTDLAGVLVIDPACGSGNTLLAAAQALAARGRVRRWGAERVAQEIEHCIWGLDPDPIACHVSELRLRRMIAHIIPDLPAARRRTLQFHIHQTDSLTLPVDARFKLVITNPPLATARGVVVSYGGFESKTPPRDVWLRFLEQSMRLVAYGGALAVALPEALLTKPSAAALREELRTEWTLEHLAHLTGVFRSGPGTVMLLARRDPPTADSVAQWERIERLALSRTTRSQTPQAQDDSEDSDDDEAEERPIRTIHSRAVRAERRMAGEIRQADLAEEARGAWRYALSGAERAFVARMAQPHGAIGRVTLGDLVQVTRGAEVRKEAPDPSPTPILNGVKLLRGSDIAPFHTQAGRVWLPASAFKHPLDVWRGPKLVLPRAGAQPSVALDDTGAVPLAALIALLPAEGDPAGRATLLFVLALLNAPPLSAYLALTQTGYQLARPTIDLDALRALPIALGPADARQRLSSLANELTRHYATHGTATDDTTHYPIAQRLTATITMEVNALYSLTPEDQAVIDRWHP